MIELITCHKPYGQQTTVKRVQYPETARGLGKAIREMESENAWAREFGYGTGRAGTFTATLKIDGMDVDGIDIADARSLGDLLKQQKLLAAKLQ